MSSSTSTGDGPSRGVRPSSRSGGSMALDTTLGGLNVATAVMCGIPFAKTRALPHQKRFISPSLSVSVAGVSTPAFRHERCQRQLQESLRCETFPSAQPDPGSVF